MTATVLVPSLTSVAGHRDRVLDLVENLSTSSEVVPVHRSAGRVLAADVRAREDHPAETNSAMDGYAVRAGDLPGRPVEVPVVGDVRAGHGPPPQLRGGAAVRIMTGAVLPAAADTVVPVEHTSAGGHTFPATGTVVLPGPLAPGAHVRHRGEQWRRGDLLLRAGTVLGAGQLAALLAAGTGEVAVRCAPRVLVVVTGDELLPAGATGRPGGVHDVNGGVLAGLLTADGARCTVVRTPDDPDALAGVLARHTGDADLVVTAGGISAGAYEVVRQLAGRSSPGVAIELRPVAMSPGRPQGAGLLHGTPVVCLPGNPVAALVSAVAFVRPLLHAAAGTSVPGAPVTTDAHPRPGVTLFLPAALEAGPAGPRAVATGGAHDLLAWARAGGALELPPTEVGGPPFFHPLTAASACRP